MLKYFLLFFLVFQAYADQYGVVLAGSTHVFWKAVVKGIYAAKEGKNNVEVIDRSPMDDNDSVAEEKSQLKMIGYFQKMKIKGLILAPIPLIGSKEKFKTNVPTIFIDRDSPDFSPPLSLVETNNYLAGKLAAREIAKRVPKGATFAILGLSKNVRSTLEREKGFKEEAIKLGMKFKFDSFLGHGFREAQSSASTILKKGNGVDVIFTSNESTTMGVVLALKNLKKRPKHVGFDYRNEFVEAMINNSLEVLIVQDPFEMGRVALEKLIEYNSGIKIEAKIFIPPFVVTKDNYESQAIQNKLKQFY